MVEKIINLLRGAWIKRCYSSDKRNPNIWVFGEWFGQRCGDNSTFFANYVANADKSKELYWVTNKGVDIAMLDSSIHILIRDSKESRHLFKKAGAVFLGQGFADLSSKGYNYFSGAKSILLWHGIPWKLIGHDGSSQTNFLYKWYIAAYDNYFRTTYCLSPSVAFDEVAQTAFGYCEHDIIKAGLPRNRIFYDDQEIAKCRNIIYDKIQYKDAKKPLIITYMPTFRDTMSSQFDIQKLFDNDKFLDFAERENIFIIHKAHQILSERGTLIETSRYDRLINLNNIDSQTLLASTDLLVTDYSSCFFDYAILNRPIIHFLYDYDYYKKSDRGLYYSQDEVAFGDVVTDIDSLVDAIITNIKEPLKYSFLRKSRAKRFLSYENSDSCRELKNKIDAILIKENYEKESINCLS